MAENTVKLTCSDCGGTMDIDADKNVILCPFCGSKKIILESDDVKIAKVELEKRKIDKDIELIKRDNEKTDTKFTVVAGIIALIVTLLLLHFGF